MRGREARLQQDGVVALGRRPVRVRCLEGRVWITDGAREQVLRPGEACHTSGAQRAVAMALAPCRLRVEPPPATGLLAWALSLW